MPRPVRNQSGYQKRLYGNPLTLLLFLGPGVAAYILMVIYPAIMSVTYSLINWQGLKPLWTWNNFKYYQLMFADSRVWAALGVNLRAWVLYAFIQVPLGLLLAFALSRKVRGKSIFRFIYYMPSVVAPVMMALMFRFFLVPDYGLNGLLRSVGLGVLAHGWLSEDGITQWVINLPATWISVGFWMVVFIAAISEIPEEIFEAAQIDGANGAQLLWHITIPGIRRVLVFAYVMVSIWALQTYIFQFAMPSSPGGPSNLNHSLGSFLTYFVINDGRTNVNWGYASTLAVLLLILSALASFMFFRVSRNLGEE